MMVTAMLPGLTNRSIQRVHGCTPAAWAAFGFLKSTCFRQENRVTQLFYHVQIAAAATKPAARVILTMNPLATKSIPNVLREVPALRFG